MKTKNLKSRKGFENRHLKPLPKETCIIFIIKLDVDGESVHLCRWIPFDESLLKNDFGLVRKPAEGYLGSARTIDRAINIGFHAWEQNNSEFIYYKIVEYPKL